VFSYRGGLAAENTRAAYPIEYIPNAKIPCVGPHLKNVILLACDAFGVLPPVSKLNLAQTMYHFISGYTALVPGTEDGIKEPQATFSPASARLSSCSTRPSTPPCWPRRCRSTAPPGGLSINTGWSGGWYVPARLIHPRRRHSLFPAQTLVRYATENICCVRGLSGTALARGSNSRTPGRSSTPCTPASSSPLTTRRLRSSAWRSPLRSTACRQRSSTLSTQ
jgi:hypothetical protein